MRRNWIVAPLCWVVLGAGLPALGAGRVVADRHDEGRVGHVVQAGGRTAGSLAGHVGSDGRALKAYGSRNGDLFPIIRENRIAPHHPWVVWSRFNQVQYDLAWSRWTPAGWEPVRWLEPDQGTAGDSLDADLGFDETGRPFVAWWRDEGGSGRIYISMFLQTTWMRSIAVSEESIDSRYPSLQAVGPDELVVRYSTENGVVEHTVHFMPPVTITDDINPLDFVFSSTIVEVDQED